MTSEQLDAMEDAARKRLQEWINRSAAQHIRQMRLKWGNYAKTA